MAGLTFKERATEFAYGVGAGLVSSHFKQMFKNGMEDPNRLASANYWNVLEAGINENAEVSSGGEEVEKPSLMKKAKSWLQNKIVGFVKDKAEERILEATGKKDIRDINSKIAEIEGLSENLDPNNKEHWDGLKAAVGDVDTLIENSNLPQQAKDALKNAVEKSAPLNEAKKNILDNKDQITALDFLHENEEWQGLQNLQTDDLTYGTAIDSVNKIESFKSQFSEKGRGVESRLKAITGGTLNEKEEVCIQKILENSSEEAKWHIEGEEVYQNLQTAYGNCKEDILDRPREWLEEHEEYFGQRNTDFLQPIKDLKEAQDGISEYQRKLKEDILELHGKDSLTGEERAELYKKEAISFEIHKTLNGDPDIVGDVGINGQMKNFAEEIVKFSDRTAGSELTDLMSEHLRVAAIITEDLEASIKEDFDAGIVSERDRSIAKASRQDLKILAREYREKAEKVKKAKLKGKEGAALQGAEVQSANASPDEPPTPTTPTGSPSGGATLQSGSADDFDPTLPPTAAAAVNGEGIQSRATADDALHDSIKKAGNAFKGAEVESGASDDRKHAALSEPILPKVAGDSDRSR